MFFCYRSIKTRCFLYRMSDSESEIAGMRGELSQLLKTGGGVGEMHYGRIYIQYFALWSSRRPGGLIVCYNNT